MKNDDSEPKGRVTVYVPTRTPQIAPAPTLSYEGDDDEAPKASRPSKSISDLLVEVYLFVMRRWVSIAAGLVLGITLAPLTFLLMPPSYQATATLMLDSSRFQLFSQAGGLGDAPIDSAAAIESQLEIMRSDLIGRRVMHAMNLSENPEFMIAERGRIARLLGPRIAELLGRSPLRTQERKERFLLDSLARSIAIRRVSGTFAVEVTARSMNATTAAELANAVTAAYIAELNDRRISVSQRTGDWLGSRVTEMRDNLTEAQLAVATFRKQHNISTSVPSEAADRRLQDLNAQLAAAQTAVNETRTKVARVVEVIDRYRTNRVTPVLSDLTSNAFAMRLQERHHELSSRFNDWTRRFGATHEATIKVRDEIREIRSTILGELNSILEAHKLDLSLAEMRVASLTDEVSKALAEKGAEQQVLAQLRELESAVANQQRVVDNFANRQVETSEQGKFPSARAWVLNEASEPITKSLKRTLALAGFVFLMGAALGLGTALARDLSDNTARRVSDVEAIFGHVPVEFLVRSRGAGTTPLADIEGPQPVSIQPVSAPARPIQDAARLIWAHHTGLDRHLKTSIDALRLRLDHASRQNSTTVVGVTAPVPGAGTSTIAAAVACATAASGSRTLLIDGNAADPRLTKLLTTKPVYGLADVLRNNLTLAEAVWTDRKSGLDFLPGCIGNDAAYEEVLASPNMRSWLRGLSTTYQYIIIDLPPMAPGVHVNISVDLFSSYFVVLPWGEVSNSRTRVALKHSDLPVDRIVAVAMNKVNQRKIRLYDAEARNRM